MRMHLSPPSTRSPAEFWSARHISRITAPILDRMADCELQQGHHAAAERFASLASAMREVAP